MTFRVRWRDGGKVKRFAERLLAGADLDALLPNIGEQAVEGTRRRFREGKGPDGQPWTPLNPAYAQAKRGAGILLGRGFAGGLAQSVTYRLGASEIQVGSPKIYAGVHQHGATITAKEADALVFRLGSSLVTVQSVTIPARPFLGLDDTDRMEIADIVEDFLADLTPGGG